MRLTSKGRYAVRAMLDLTSHSNGNPVRLQEISTRQNISLHYLEQLFRKLRNGAAVKSVRGPGGGYRLSRFAAEVFVAQIIDAVDEKVDVTRCAGNGDCQDGETCLTHDLWQDRSKQIHQFLSSISLQNLLDRNAVKEVAERQDKKQHEHGQEPMIPGRLNISELG